MKISKKLMDKLKEEIFCSIHSALPKFIQKGCLNSEIEDEIEVLFTFRFSISLKLEEEEE